MFSNVLVSNNTESFSAVNVTAVEYNSCQGSYILGEPILLVNNQNFPNTFLWIRFS